MKINQKSLDIISYFDEILPDARCALNYNKDYELLIAVMLSAQTTDKAVNNVTDKLFRKYNTLHALKNASYQEIANEIKCLGLYQNKAKNILAISSILVDKFDSVVPSDFEKLTSLPGVGRKTANVVRCELFNIDEFPVDTHINRIAKRLKYAYIDDDILVVEKKLRKSFPSDKYIRLHHQFIHFGRSVCTSQNPKCMDCKLQKYCRYYKDINKKK